MNKRSLMIVVAMTILAMISIAESGQRGAMVGNYRPIRDLNEPHVQEIGRYAISKHNEMDGTHLEFVRIVRGESQVVAGTNYRFQISAKDGAALRDYLAVVYERPWDNFRNLSSFLPL